MVIAPLERTDYATSNPHHAVIVPASSRRGIVACNTCSVISD